MNIEPLKQIPLFKHLTNEELEFVVQFTNVVSYSPGTRILEQGRPCPGLFVILTGTVDIMLKLPGDKDIQYNTLQQGQCIGEISFIDKGLCTTSVFAAGEVTCLILERDTFRMLHLYNRNLAHKLIAVLCQGLSKKIAQLYADLAQYPQYNQHTVSLLSKSRSKSISHANGQKKLFALKEHLFLFKQFTEDEVISLMPYIDFYAYEKGDVVYCAGAALHQFYCVVQGTIQSVIESESNAIKCVVWGPSQMFATVARFLKNTCPSSYIVRETSLLMSVSHNQFDQLQHENDALWIKLYAALSVQMANELRMLSAHMTRIRSLKYFKDSLCVA